MTKMQGLTLQSLKKHPSLIPLFVVFGVGLVGSTGYLLRLAMKNPDVSWSPKKNPEPWQEYKNKHYKLYYTVDPDKIETVKIPKY